MLCFQIVFFDLCDLMLRFRTGVAVLIQFDLQARKKRLSLINYSVLING